MRSVYLITEAKLAEIINVFRSVEISSLDNSLQARYSNGNTRSSAILTAVDVLQKLVYSINLAHLPAQEASDQVTLITYAVQFLELLVKNKQ